MYLVPSYNVWGGETLSPGSHCSSYIIKQVKDIYRVGTPPRSLPSSLRRRTTSGKSPRPREHHSRSVQENEGGTIDPFRHGPDRAVCEIKQDDPPTINPFPIQANPATSLLFLSSQL